MLTLADYGFHSCLMVIPKRELEFKIAVTAGLRDMNSMSQENQLCLHFICLLSKNFAASILLGVSFLNSYDAQYFKSYVAKHIKKIKQ